jgi:hypothetical protein
MAAEPKPVVDATLAPPTGESSVEWVRLAAGEKAGEDVPAGAQTTRNEHKFLPRQCDYGTQRPIPPLSQPPDKVGTVWQSLQLLLERKQKQLIAKNKSSTHPPTNHPRPTPTTIRIPRASIFHKTASRTECPTSSCHPRAIACLFLVDTSMPRGANGRRRRGCRLPISAHKPRTPTTQRVAHKGCTSRVNSTVP